MRLDPILIIPYDPTWPESFERARRSITPALAPWTVRDIEHMGSTAVPGLPAKAIIDMLAVVADVDDATNAIAPLHEIGWLHAPEPFDDADRKLSFCTPSIEQRTHHLHVVEASSTPWRGWLAFRDYLRAHPETARQYAELKQQLAAAHGDNPDDRDVYRGGKADFVQRITALALER